MNEIAALTSLPPVAVTIVTAVLVFGATLRLARFLTSDTLGEWLIVGPLRRWAMRAEESRRLAIQAVAEKFERSGEEMTERASRYLAAQLEALENTDMPISWQARLVSGAECPFCWAFWMGLIVTAVTVVVTMLAAPVLIISWYVVLAALTLNYIVGHIVSRID